MQEENVYAKLAERVTRMYGSPSFPASKRLPRILEKMLTFEEGNLLLGLGSSVTIDELARRLNMEEEVVENKLKDLDHRGLVLRTSRGYRFQTDMAYLHFEHVANGDVVDVELLDLWKELCEANRHLGAAEANAGYLEKSNTELRAKISQLEIDMDEMRDSTVKMAQKMFERIGNEMQARAQAGDAKTGNRQPHPDGTSGKYVLVDDEKKEIAQAGDAKVEGDGNRWTDDDGIIRWVDDRGVHHRTDADGARHMIAITGGNSSSILS